MIGILSDSHDNLTALRAAVRLFRDAGCDLLVHAGDIVAPFAIKELAAAGCPVKAVFGNCDGEEAGLTAAIEPFGLILQAPLAFEHAGQRFLVTHRNAPAEEYASRGAYQVVIFGHTHKSEIRRKRKTLMINPGEAGGWVTGKCTVALYDPGKEKAEILVV